MKSIKLWACVVSVLISYVGAQTQMKFDGMRYSGEISRSFDVKDAGDLTIRDISGSVSVVGEARRDVQIIERFRINSYSESGAEKILQNEKARFVQKGNTIIVEGQRHSRRYSSDFIIKTPQRFNLDIKTSGGDLDIESITGANKLGTSGGDIEMDLIVGDVEAHTSGGDISINESKGDLSVSTSGGDITLKQVRGNIQAETSGGDIVLRQIKGKTTVSTSGGDINVVDLEGDRLEATTSGGDIGADEIRGNTRLHTSGGNIVVGKIEGSLDAMTSGGNIEIKEVFHSLNAHTSGGNIRVGLVAEDCRLVTSGGNIEVAVARNAMSAKTSGGDIIISRALGAVKAETSGGDIEVFKYLNGRSTDQSITMSSSGGDLILYLPSEARVTIDATILLNRFGGDYEIRSDFPLKINREEKGSRIYLTGAGKLNGGGARVSMQTTEGDIRIKRAI